MDISATSFLHLLQNISEAVNGKKSAADYDGLLQKFFEESSPYDYAVADSDTQSKLVGENFPSEKIFGRHHEKNMLMSQLIGPVKKGIQQLSVIPILGGCGIGKTTLARLVYEDEVVKKHFELRAWVKVDGQDFTLHHAAREILKYAFGMSCSLDDLEELDEMVRDTLQSQRCLIVFDGIESMAKDSWRHMNKYWFDFVDLGSWVLITTTSKGVADLVANQSFELSQLYSDVCLSMCKYLLFGSSEDMEHMSSPMAENLSALCQGTPLSLKLVGSLMRHDDKLRDLLSSVDFSNGILLPPFDASVVVLLCIWGLPPHLRQCLAYCAIFPKGLALSKEKIVDMWIAHGLVKPYPGNNNLHDIGDSYFHQLLCRSFFTDIIRNQYNDIMEFQIPGLIHKMVKDIAIVIYKAKLALICSIAENGGQLSLVLPFSEKYKSEDMQTLILSPALYLGGSLYHSLREFKGLQSLDLSCSGIRNLSEDLRSLKELRYLNLSYTLIQRVPDCITDLSQLQTLDLSCCYHLTILPKGMRNLMHMRHLDLSQCESLTCLPSGIGFLISLSSVPLFILGKDHDCAGLGDLGLLKQLRGRLEIRNLENVREISEAQDAKLDQKYLNHLGLSWSQNADNCFPILELLQPNHYLKVLELTGYASFLFPRWMSSINSLIKIIISDCGCRELPSLGQLPFLKELQLKGMTSLERIGPEFYGDAIDDAFFPSLEQLGLHDLPRLSEWSGETLPNSSGVISQCLFPSLKTLTIDGCPKLSSLPSLPTLPDLIVQNSNKSILSCLTSFASLSSLLINDMELGVSNFLDLSWLDSLKKLILCNIKDKLLVNISYGRGTTFAALEHLGILHCHQLTDICLFYFSSLQKLHIVDCPNLYRILVREEKNTPLVELVVEHCPEVFSEIYFSKLHSLRKLIVKNCGAQFTIYYAGEYKKLDTLEYLSISGCPRIERELETFPSLISHVPCIIVGDHKANYKDMQDLMEVPIKASYESEEEDLVHQMKDSKVGFKSSLTCCGAFSRERRGSFSFLRTVRSNTCLRSHVMT